MLRNDREKAECRRLLNSWSALKRNVERMAGNFSIDATVVSALLDDQICILSEELHQYETAIHHAEIITLTSPIELLTNIDRIPASLVQARLMLSWSQQDFAKNANLTQQQVSRYERTCYATMRFSNVIDIAKLLCAESKKLIK